MEDAQNRRNQIWLIFVASVVIMMGMQFILPVLPVIQQEFNLSDSQIALVTSAYLLPSVVFALVSGLLADRFGRNLVYAGALAIFGVAGLGIALTQSFTVLLLIRLVQGAAFAAVAPLSITMIGDMLAGTEQVAVQGYRTVAMSAGDAVLPVLGGALVTLGWHVPFALQVIAIPLALFAWFMLPRGIVADHSTTVHLRALFRTMQRSAALSLQLAGFSRMFFKFAYMTYLPILLVSSRGMTPGFAGLVLGGAALCGTLVAAASGRLVRLVAPSRLVAASLVFISVAFVVVAVAGKSQVLILLASLGFGAGDGAYGVMQNAAVTQVISDDLRATFVAATGSVRNFGKFLAPSLLGLSTLVLPLELSFIVMAVFALLALLIVVPLSRLDDKLVDDTAKVISS